MLAACCRVTLGLPLLALQGRVWVSKQLFVPALALHVTNVSYQNR